MDAGHSPKGRRENDALAPRPGDSPFSLAVKGLARARGWTAAKLAEKLGLADQSSITRALGHKRRGTRASTAEAFAEKLEVPAGYLRILAVGWTNPDDVQAASRYWRLLFDEAAEYFTDNGVGAWHALLALANSSKENVVQVVADAHFAALERAAFACVGIAKPQPESIVVICQALKRVGIDAREWIKNVDDDDLYGTYLYSSSRWPHGRALRDVDVRRQWLKDVGLYQPDMEMHLDSLLKDPRYFPNKGDST